LPGIRLARARSYTDSRLPSSSQNGFPRTESHEPGIAYLLSRYPAISHTFFLKEVRGMRERGLPVEVASINAPDRPIEDLPAVEAFEAEHAYYVKSAGIGSIALKLLTIVVLHPGVACRGLFAALQLGKWDLKARAFSLFYLAEALLVGNWMRQRSLRHLHVHFGGAVATVGMLASKAWQIPWSITLHGPDEFFDQESFYLRQKIESAQFVVCISDFCRSQVLRIAPDLPFDRLEVVRLGVDCTLLRPRSPSGTKAASPRQPKSIRIVCTGRMVSAKGHRILLQALALLESHSVDFSCTLIGDGPERASIERVCNRLGITSKVRFLGALAHEQTLSEVAQADVFVLASFAEGLPVALMEAMALGVPCLSTVIAAIPELIEDKENGLLVPASNPEALCRALRRFADDEEFRGWVGQKARITVEISYNLTTNLNLLAEVWKRRLLES
jgi:colanic acid/amylovoran biosynthesis glycosyltransferase